MSNPQHQDYPPAGVEMTDAEWYQEMHGEDDELKAMAADLRQAYEALGSPHPIEDGHWLALANAIAD